MTNKTLKTNEIVVLPERQRKELGDLSELAASISRFGVLFPLIVRDGNILVAGERRLRAAMLAGVLEVPVRDFSSLSAIEAEEIELEENIRRKDLTWQETSQAILRLHNIYKNSNPSWTIEGTAQKVGITASQLGNYLSLGEAVKEGDEKVTGIDKMSEAMTVIRRRRAVALEKLSNEILQIDDEEKPEEQEIKTAKAYPIICADFIEWASTYSGPKFDFIHCDFPYGVNLQNSGQVSSAFDLYQDDPDVYWTLLRAFVENFDKFASKSAHVMFWFSMKFYEQTFDALSEILDVQQFPLVWVKSDQKGIVPDAMRQPRRIYETALIATRGDRSIRAVKNNAYHGPTEISRFHISAKPIDMLEYFFEMFIDEQTRMLDPTCGSGNAVYAAFRKGAAHYFGIEKNSEFVNQISFSFGE